MRASKSEVYLHFVWSTRGRDPVLDGESARMVHRCIEAEARGAGCDVLAIGGMPDHVHLLVKAPTKVSPASLMHQVRGVSSAFVRDHLGDVGGFRWQEGYGVFSVSRTHVRIVIEYVEHQAEHHASGTVWPAIERSGEEPDTAGPEGAEPL